MAIPSAHVHADPGCGSGSSSVLSRVIKALLAPAPQLSLIDGGHSQRVAVEHFIAERFNHHHGAQVQHFLPLLMTLHHQGNTVAALGLRSAIAAPLFLEKYLLASAEQVVAGMARAPVSRGGIVEVGNLVSERGGASSLLFLLLVAAVHRAGFSWVMFTATAQVLRSIERLGLVVESICPALPECLGDDAAAWGTYYDNRPQVVLGNVQHTMARCGTGPLMSAITSQYEEQLAAVAAMLAARQ